MSQFPRLWEYGPTTNLATKAVPNTRDALDAQVLADVLDCRLDNGLDARGLVVGDPLGEVNLAGLHIANVDGVATEEVGQDGQVAIVGELVSEQLAVDEEAEDVGEDDDGLFGGLVVLGVGEVGVDWESQDIIIILYKKKKERKEKINTEEHTTSDVLHFADGGALMLEAGGTARSGGVRGHFEKSKRK